ncbi:DNA-binding protein [Salmonella enterica]
MVADKEWYTASELTGLPGLAGDKSSINRKANREDWVRRQKKGTRGVAFEFHISSFPSETQEALGGYADNTEDNQNNEIDIEALQKIIEAVEILVSQRRRNISAKTKAKIIVMIYKSFKKQGVIDDSFISDVIELVA